MPKRDNPVELANQIRGIEFYLFRRSENLSQIEIAKMEFERDSLKKQLATFERGE